MAERVAGRVTTLPNLLGVARIAATPVVMALLLLDAPGTDLAAAIVFVVAGFTDYVDGRMARARDQVTPLGTFMDLAADKVLVSGVLIAMVQEALVPAWIAATIVAREFVVQAVRQLAAAEAVVIAAAALGKAKTVLTLGGMGIVLLAADGRTGGPMSGTGLAGPLAAVGAWALALAAVLTVISGVVYLRAAWPLLRGERG